MSAIPLVFTSGWASGINCYAVVVMLGMLGRFGHMSAVPPTLARPDVLAVAAVLFVCQFLVGKIPYLDAIWDLLHTAVRPLIGGAIGVLMAHQAHGSLTQAFVVAAIGGGTSLTTHLVKTGVRMGLNTSPEPVSNGAVSLLEDLAVAGMVVFALLYPVLAAALAATLLLLGLVLLALLARRIGRTWRSLRTRRQGRVGRGAVSRAHLPAVRPSYRRAKAPGAAPMNSWTQAAGNFAETASAEPGSADRSEAARNYWESPHGSSSSRDDWW